MKVPILAMGFVADSVPELRILKRKAQHDEERGINGVA